MTRIREEEEVDFVALTFDFLTLQILDTWYFAQQYFNSKFRLRAIIRSTTVAHLVPELCEAW